MGNPVCREELPFAPGYKPASRCCRTSTMAMRAILRPRRWGFPNGWLRERCALEKPLRYEVAITMNFVTERSYERIRTGRSWVERHELIERQRRAIRERPANGRVVLFATALEMKVIASDEHHSRLECHGFELVVHQIPQHIAEGITIERPPKRRVSGAIRLDYPVADIEKSRTSGARAGRRYRRCPAGVG